MSLEFDFNPNQPPLTIVSDLLTTRCSEMEPTLGKMLADHLNTEVQIVIDYLTEHPNTYEQETILLAVWLHDSGTAWPIDGITDHAVASEIHAKEILLKIGYPIDKTDRVCHICRSHRNKPDYPPQTPEAKLFVAIDSASHFPQGLHMDVFTRGEIRNEVPLEQQTNQLKANLALDKLERDWRDMADFPDLQETYRTEYLRLKQLFTNNL